MQNSLKKMFIVDGLTVLFKINTKWEIKDKWREQLIREERRENKYIFYISKNRDNTEYTNK